jgi:hypothetical protein
MKFLIQTNLMGEQSLHDIQGGLQNLPHEFVGVIPFSHEVTANNTLEGIDYIPYGSTLFIKVAAEKGWRGVHFDIDKFNYRVASAMRWDMLNGGSPILKVWNAIDVLKREDPNKTYFFRPSADLKQFSGQMMKAGEAAKWLESATISDSTNYQQISPDDYIVIGFPREILAEWRHFIVDGRVVSSAMYRRRGQLIRNRESDPEVLKEAQGLANLWLPDKCCVMDTALIETESGERELKVIEFNCINGSGFYGHDIHAIFSALYKYHATTAPLSFNGQDLSFLNS